MTHKIYVKNEVRNVSQRLDSKLIRRAVKAALAAECVDIPCEISVLVTDDLRIQAVNHEYRGINAPTDILSFPCFEFVAGEFDANDGEVDISTGLLPLGDIVLSAERVDKQAAEYGQTRERETAYLVVHSVLHLLGYDHVDEGADKCRMREREDEIMGMLK